ncbi:hypothetical protein G6F40_017169 [Rhizopus arrhizus]|nr:hypothetical protein G6F40_017169 [Rhizopus arrhizus]
MTRSWCWKASPRPASHGRGRLDADHHRRVPAAGVRRRHRRPAVPRPGVDGGDRHRDLAAGVYDADPDAELAEGTATAGVPGRGTE